MATEFSISSISWSLRRDCKEYAPQLIPQVEALHIASRDFEDALFLPVPDTPLRAAYERLVGRCYANLQELEGLLGYRRRRGIAAEGVAGALERLRGKLEEDAGAWRELGREVEGREGDRGDVDTATPVGGSEKHLQPYVETVVDSEDEPFEEIAVPVETEPPSPVSPVRERENEDETAGEHPPVGQRSPPAKRMNPGRRSSRLDGQRPRRSSQRTVPIDGQSVWSSAADCGGDAPTDQRRRVARRAKKKEKTVHELQDEIRREEDAQRGQRRTRFEQQQQQHDSWQFARPPPHTPSPYLDGTLMMPYPYPYPYQYAAQYTAAYPFRPTSYPAATAAGWQNGYQPYPYAVPGSPAPPTSSPRRCGCANVADVDRVFYVDGMGVAHLCLHV
ncbi:uncharacterized protein BKA78DRAFT_143164 [Phyllosticta capitalensis]|uniref:uncharacterized protein n=1 Tax=Phyllosticta capitalensis TaxID=121624 RepID=UPI00312E51C8